MSNYAVIVEKAKAQVTPEEKAALEKISASSNFYRLSLNYDQLKKFWDWFNAEIKQPKQETSQ